MTLLELGRNAGIAVEESDLFVIRRREGVGGAVSHFGEVWPARSIFHLLYLLTGVYYKQPAQELNLENTYKKMNQQILYLNGILILTKYICFISLFVNMFSQYLLFKKHYFV